MTFPIPRISAAAMLLIGMLPAGGRLAAQSNIAIIAGVGTSSWSGPYLDGGKTGFALFGVAAERPVSRSWSIRGELAGQRDAGDLGATGLFEQPTTLLVYRAHVAAMARLYPAAIGRRQSLYVEAGLSGWAKAGCDVDLSGGPGFFGGETLGCGEWIADDATEPPLRPKSAGANVVIGAGTYIGRFGIGVRYEPTGTAVIDTDRGAIRVRALTVTVEWTPKGRS